MGQFGWEKGLDRVGIIVRQPVEDRPGKLECHERLPCCRVGRLHVAKAKTRRAILRGGFWTKQFTLNETPRLTGPVKRRSKFLSTDPDEPKRARRPPPPLINSATS